MLRRLLCFLCCLWSLWLVADTSQLPVAYQGRIRPLEAAARLWLYDFYHAQSLRPEKLTAVDFLWLLDERGHAPWDDTPLFWIQSVEVKNLLRLNPHDNRFSYHQLRHAFLDDRESNLAVVKALAIHAFSEAVRSPSNRSGATRLELAALAPGLWVTLRSDTVVLVQKPTGPLWRWLAPGDVLGTLTLPQSGNKAVLDELTALWNSLTAFEQHQPRGHKAMPPLVEGSLPLRQRLLEAGTDLRLLPSRLADGEWYSIRAVDVHVIDGAHGAIVPVGNFTLYPDALFDRIRTHYQAGDLDGLTADLLLGYKQLSGTLSRQGAGKALYYPTTHQLEAESAYYRLPLTFITLVLYALTAIVLALAVSLKRMTLGRVGLACLAVAWLLHTAILVLRCYILGRPPVANMFETLVYVPWISVFLSFFLYYAYRAPVVPLAASVLAVALLTLLEVTQTSSGMETLQPVLDSQYWLIIHVLLVVASYGVFLLSGLLGHLYLGALKWMRQELPVVGKAILHTCLLYTSPSPRD